MIHSSRFIHSLSPLIVISIITICTPFDLGVKIAGLDSMEDTPMVQLGDASTAAPFTTRTPSISSVSWRCDGGIPWESSPHSPRTQVVDIIRQGRCTLLSAVQQMLG